MTRGIRASIPRYAGIDPADLPAAESLKDTLARVLPFWNRRIAPELRAGRNVLVAAHGNSLRAMVKMLDHVPEKDIVELNIPTGVPLLYELDPQLKPLGSRYPRRPGRHRGSRRSSAPANREEELKARLGFSAASGRPRRRALNGASRTRPSPLRRPPVIPPAKLRSDRGQLPAQLLHVGDDEPHFLRGMQAEIQLRIVLQRLHVNLEPIGLETARARPARRRHPAAPGKSPPGRD